MKLQKKMKKKDKKWYARVLAINLAQKCYQRNQKGKDAAHSGYDGTICQNSLTEVFARENALVYERASLVGYLKIVAALFKITFFRKKRNGLAPAIQGFVFVQ